jgi:hypothetical protein
MKLKVHQAVSFFSLGIMLLDMVHIHYNGLPCVACNHVVAKGFITNALSLNGLQAVLVPCIRNTIL